MSFRLARCPASGTPGYHAIGSRLGWVHASATCSAELPDHRPRVHTDRRSRWALRYFVVTPPLRPRFRSRVLLVGVTTASGSFRPPLGTGHLSFLFIGDQPGA